MNKYELYFTFSIIIISPTPTETETVLLHVMPNLSRHAVRVLSLQSSVIHGFVTEPWYSRHVRVSCERAASSVLVHSLSSAYLVSCWSVVFRSRHSCLEFRFLVGFGHLRSVFCVSARSRVRSAARSPVHVCFVVLHAVRVFIGCVHSCYILCCVARSLCISLAACFHVVMSCVNMSLMSLLISCVFMSSFAHGWWIVCWPCACVFVLCEHVASVLVFCVPRALMSICLDPTHLVTCLLINCPQLLSLTTLLICSLIISLCLQSCASSSSFHPECILFLPCRALSCPVLPCQACQLSCFSPTG